MVNVSLFLSFVLVSLTMAASMETGITSNGASTVAISSTMKGPTDMDGADSNYVSQAYPGRVQTIRNDLIDENFVGLSSTRICAALGTSVINLNQCCSLSAGPIDNTNIKKCCIPVGSSCNESPNSCCYSKQQACLETHPGSPIFTCQPIDVQVQPVYPSLGVLNNGYSNVNTLNTGYSNANIGYSTVNTGYPSVNTGYSTVNTGYPSVNTGYSTVNTGYSTVNTGYPSVNTGYDTVVNTPANPYGLNTVTVNGVSASNYANNPVTSYATNTASLVDPYSNGVNTLSVDGVVTGVNSNYGNSIANPNYGSYGSYAAGAAASAGAGAGAAGAAAGAK